MDDAKTEDLLLWREINGRIPGVCCCENLKMFYSLFFFLEYGFRNSKRSMIESARDSSFVLSSSRDFLLKSIDLSSC